MRVKSPLLADKILAAAAQLFATHRFHEARMEDVASLADVAKGTLYRYFKDKEALYLALLQRAAQEIQVRLRQAVAAAPGARAALVGIVAGLITYFDEQPHLFDLIQHAEAMQRAGQQFPWQKTRNETLALVKDLFHTGAKEGAFRIADPDLAALMLLGGLRAISRFGARPRPDRLAESIVTSFLEGQASPSVRCGRRAPIDGVQAAFHNA